MTRRKSEYIPFLDGHTHVSTWGEPSAPALIMWHGLARTGRDFDAAAERLSQTYFVICPDTIGRGLSSWASAPETEYSLTNYAAQAQSVVTHFGINKLRWFGTSMGGFIGMMLAGGPLKAQITHLVLNDIGPEVPFEAAMRIVQYVGTPPLFAGIPDFEDWLRETYAPFGQNDDAFWRCMAETSSRRLPDGQITTHYDPKIVMQFNHAATETPLWGAYDNITARSLLTRGAESDVLPVWLTHDMRKRGPKPQFHTFENCGHAPTFTTPDAITLLESFLSK